MERTLVTGASSGIGEELAREFAGNGHDLIIAGRSKDKLEMLKAELEKNYEIKVNVFVCDLSKEKERKSLFSYTQKEELEVEILVNNAGFGDNDLYLNSNWEKQKDMINVNVLALMHLTYLYGNEMKKRRRGKILNISSVAAFSAGPRMSVYYASKSFVLSFSEALYEELKEYGVTVTALCPGPTNTSFEKNAGMKNTKMFSAFGSEPAGNVAKCGYKALMKGKAVAYHGKVTYVFNLITRLTTRRFSRKLAEKLD